MCRQENWRLAVWDAARGLQVVGGAQKSADTGCDPLAAISSIGALAASPDSSELLVLANFHRFLASAEILQVLAQQIAAGK